MQVTVHLTPEIAREFKQGVTNSPAASDIVDATNRLGVTLRPLHPGSTDPALESIFIVNAKDGEHAKTVVSELQACPGIEAAYVKPPPAMP